MSEALRQARKRTRTMGLRLKIIHKGLILVLVPCLFELIFLFALWVLLQQAEIEVQRQVRSKEIIAQANSFSKLFYDVGVAMAGYSITRSPIFSDRYEKLVHQIPIDLENMKNLIGDNVRQQQTLANLEGIINTAVRLLQEAKSAIDSNQVDMAQFRARHVYKEIRGLADRLQEELRTLTEDERRLEDEGPVTGNRSRNAVAALLALGVVANIVLAIVLGLVFSRQISKRLNVLTDNSIRLARGESLNPLVSGADEIAQLDGVFHSMAAALNEASRKERAIVENAADVICSIDADGKFVAVSPASESTFGYKEDELTGRRFIELAVPDDIESTASAMRAIRSEKTTMSFENRARRKDGVVVNILWSAYWSDSERSMFCVAHDITERKLAEAAIQSSEARIRTIMDNMMVALVIFTKEGFIESVNPSAERIFARRADELIGKHALSLFQESKTVSEPSFQDKESFLAALYQKSLYKIGEAECLRSTAEVFPVQISLTEFQSTDGPRYMANILDVSERTEVERLKKEFVATVSHELRTPLTSISGSLTLLNVGALGLLPEQAKKAVDIAERNTRRLITLINDILEIEKIEAGKLDMVFEEVPIASVIERAAEAVRSFSEQHGVKIDIKPSQAKVFADGDRLVQVIVNLVSNGVKFSPKGETVTILADEIPNWVEVKIIDHGRGIPAQYKNLLFHRFQQVERADAAKRGGTGLGLAICKGIIEQHSGAIGVDSEEGRGSTFWFRIPKAHTGIESLSKRAS